LGLFGPEAHATLLTSKLAVAETPVILADATPADAADAADAIRSATISIAVRRQTNRQLWSALPVTVSTVCITAPHIWVGCSNPV
jgi:hypothetical protein